MKQTNEAIQADRSAKSQMETYEKVQKDSLDKEFARYKQDCRKRALDLAHSENNSFIARTSGSLNQSNLSNTNRIDIVKTADKYYEWLISIPLDNPKVKGKKEWHPPFKVIL